MENRNIFPANQRGELRIMCCVDEGHLQILRCDLNREDGVSALEKNANGVQQAAHKDQRKEDAKSLFLIHQCVDPNVFEKIIEEEMTKRA